MPRRKTTATEPESATQPAGQGRAPAAQGNLAKLQAILREIFQFDSADLDFGIYRILNFKRDAIQRFLEQDLPQTVSAELAKGALATESAAERELKDLERQVRETLGEEALSPDGALQEAFHGTNLGKQYLSAQGRAVGAKGREALEALVFSHLHSFFSRYYDSGDFLSKRRYSKNQRYAIPYNGEEVYLHWANSDQYYIKTLEHFTNYTFRSLGFTVHFLLRSAQAETDGSQQERRFFLPLVHEAAFDAKTMEATIPFEHRPLTTKEQITYGGRSQQESILSTALEVLPKALRGHPELLDALLHEERRGSNGQPVSCIAHHLTRYTQRNTSDFFIHKDLKGFLEKELDFYIKNEVLSVDELEAAGEQRAKGWFQILSVLRTIGRRIIAFLAQIEDFQKKLYEKKKFITETNYLITLQAVPERLLADIAGNDVQWQEWKELYRIDENQRNLFTPNGKQARRIAFLKANPTLVVDTKLFSEDFTDRLLASFDDLDGNLAGLLVHSENFQALNALLQRYGGSVACVYIDPPYNSKTTAILYKNDYKHSSWLSLMDNRLALSKRLAATNGSHVVAIDENEQEVLGRLLSSHFADYTRVCVAVVHNKKGIQGDYFSFNHDYAYFCIPPSVPATHGKPIPESEWEYMNLRKWGRESERSTAKNCFYPIYVKGSEIVGFGEVCDDTFHPRQANVRQSEGIVAVYPIDGQGVERKWRYARASVERIRHLLRVHATPDGIQVHKARAESPVKTVWDDPRYIAGDHGTKWLTNLGLKLKEDLYPKSIHTVMDSVHAVSGPNGLILDYFAGSGTTGHAVIRLNQGDGGSRRFILAEIGDYFETVLVPRIKKVVFAPEWRDGKPARQATAAEAERSPRLIKYIRLESYEDALNNIAFSLPGGQTTLDFDDYLLKYMLDWETKESATLLNVEKLSSPFSYELVLTEGHEITKKLVDIPETFAYLLGLHVRTRREFNDGERRYLVYRGAADGREIAVIWRETEGWSKKDFERDKTFVADQQLTEGAQEVFVNGDSLIPGARALEPIFKARMFGGA